MIFDDHTLFKIFIFVLGVCGFWVAKKVRDHKKKNTRLICPIGFDCHTVVHSNYSKFLGIPVELLGEIYYSLISVAYFGFIFLPKVIPIFLVFLIIASSSAAFLFSIYLVFVQLFILRKGCSWCFVSALISAFIFVLTILTYDFNSLVQVFIT